MKRAPLPAFLPALLAALLIPFAAVAAETVIVVANGVGDTVKSAERAAFRAAVEKVVGTLVDAETLVANDEIVQTRILAYSNGFVETFETVEGPSKNADGLLAVTIRARVRKGLLAEKVTAAFKTEAAVDGGGLFAELLTRQDAMQDAQAMVGKLLEGIPADLLVAEVATGPDGKAKVKLDARTGNVTVDVVVRVDPESYLAWTDKLRNVLDKASASAASWRFYRIDDHLKNREGLPVLVPRHFSDFDFDLVPIDVRNSARGFEEEEKVSRRVLEHFAFVEYSFSEDMAPLLDLIAGKAQGVEFSLSVLDASGRALCEKRQRVSEYFVVTDSGIVPGWCSSMWVRPSVAMTVNLGAFTPEALRAAARFQCRILGRTEPFAGSSIDDETFPIQRTDKGVPPRSADESESGSISGDRDEDGRVSRRIEIGESVFELKRVSPVLFMGTTEVTQKLWTEVMGNNPSCFPGADHPVDNVSWNDCQAFLGKLNALPAAKRSGLRFRLPSKQEWDSACRAGATGFYCMLADGTEIRGDSLDRVAWFEGTANATTHPVAKKEPNAFGLFDMHGNVWEWTSTSSSEDKCVLRGGSWTSSEGLCGLVYYPDYADGCDEKWEGHYGFRLCAEESESTVGMEP